MLRIEKDLEVNISMRKPLVIFLKAEEQQLLHRRCRQMVPPSYLGKCICKKTTSSLYCNIFLFYKITSHTKLIIKLVELYNVGANISGFLC